MKKKVRSNLIYSLFLLMAFLLGCLHPSANGNAVDSLRSKNDSQIAYHRGAASEKELANALFNCVCGKIPFDSLKNFIPNSLELKSENILLKKDSTGKTSGAEFAASMDALKNDIAMVEQRAQTAGILLADAHLDDIHSELNESPSENSSKLTLLGSQNYKNFKIDAHIIKIGAYWYLNKQVVFETAN